MLQRSAGKRGPMLLLAGNDTVPISTWSVGCMRCREGPLVCYWLDGIGKWIVIDHSSLRRNVVRQSWLNIKQDSSVYFEQVIAPRAAETICRPPAADGSSTSGGSTSVRGRVHDPHVFGARPAAGSQRAYSLGCDRQPDGRIAVSLNAARTAGTRMPVHQSRL